VLYTMLGCKAGIQRLCAVRERHMSTLPLCVWHGLPGHPESRTGEAYSCLGTHLNDPDCWASRKTPRSS
jgi:hypothetical protein